MTIAAINPMTPSSSTNPDRFYDEHANEGERTYSLFNHLIGLLSLADIAIPAAALIGTAIMWRVKRENSVFIDDHGREATNFQISILVYLVIGMAFGLVTLGLGFFLSLPFMLLMLVLKLVACIRGAMAANRGEYYRYPMCIRFLKAPSQG